MKYLAFYDTVENRAEKRNCVLSSANKLRYIFTCLERLQIPCEILSASGTKGKKSVKKKEVKLSECLTLKLPFSFGQKNKFCLLCDMIQLKAHLLLELLKISRDETLIVYHSLFYMSLVKLAKKIKKFQLILEVEEIYGDVMEKRKVSAKELRYFSTADRYIFPTILLNDKINKENKPYAIIHGTYQVEEPLGESIFGAEQETVHCVYAGTFDPRKGGAFAAIAAAEFLPENFHIHILGFGCSEEIQSIKQAIEETKQKAKAKISYDGCLSGEDYIRFLQSCQIGLSTQNPTAAFNDTSFPSKILSYMANGLKVVSVRIHAIENSSIGDYMCYYEEQTSENIAKAIISAANTLKDYDGRAIISQLDEQFNQEIKSLLMKGE